MKACVLKAKNIIEYQDVEKPIIESDEVLVEVKACGICSSDFNRVYGDSAYFYPIILGHEFSGKIIKCGAKVDNSLISKRVTVFPLLPCFECEFCKKQQYAQCKNYKYFGSRNNGAMAEYIAVPIWNIKVLPDDMDYSIASLAEPTAVACHALNKKSVITNKTICISGTGTIGILIGMIARNRGADVTFVLRNNKKKEFLEQIGFTNFITNIQGEYDIVYECVGTEESINNCIKLVKSHGCIVLVGNPVSNLQVEKNIYWKLLRSEIEINGVWNSNFKNSQIDDWDSAIEFLYNNQSLVKNLITHKFRFSECKTAFKDLKQTTNLKIKGVFIND